MIQLFRVAYAHNGALEVGLVLSSIRCGFFSQDETVCELAIEVMERVSEAARYSTLAISLMSFCM